MSAAVRVQGLSRRFGDLTAVDGLDFEVAPGELFGLVGPDGAGKTTTLRMLAGVLAPSAGDALLAGVSVARDPEGVKPQIAYMSQRFGLYVDLTVAENLAFYADLYRVPRGERAARLARLYRFSNLEPFRDRLAGKLSGGMKQKLGLSCALIHQPRILLLDERESAPAPVALPSAAPSDQGLCFPQLFGVLAVLFFFDLLIPDLIPFMDELLLGLLTLAVGSLRKAPEPEAAAPPPIKSVTPRER